ncbi:hypothetical protein TGPRC2_283570 [Toxoplasma gondii TgCatPRC2]|uniref:Uncharacterized protein n=2 Tax=Toxoplasma gondii TaxID=5811 RepID=A0A151H1Q8_TOXGO|nr:hypothetical protein TGPRC2_283570 [Toxoplasma gondii TgCatPRC2]PIM00383.1 hypothetical protein TGCOUG_283570 [Toxoplasma gondii COUG]
MARRLSILAFDEAVLTSLLSRRCLGGPFPSFTLQVQPNRHGRRLREAFFLSRGETRGQAGNTYREGETEELQRIREGREPIAKKTRRERGDTKNRGFQGNRDASSKSEDDRCKHASAIARAGRLERCCPRRSRLRQITLNEGTDAFFFFASIKQHIP